MGAPKSPDTRQSLELGRRYRHGLTTIDLTPVTLRAKRSVAYPDAMETERFRIEDEGDGWLRLERLGADAMSLRARELDELIELLIHARRERVVDGRA
jgi:hypothetical protein